MIERCMMFFARLHAWMPLVKFYCIFLCTSVNINLMQKTMHMPRRERRACVTLLFMEPEIERPAFIKNVIKWMLHSYIYQAISRARCLLSLAPQISVNERRPSQGKIESMSHHALLQLIDFYSGASIFYTFSRLKKQLWAYDNEVTEISSIYLILNFTWRWSYFIFNIVLDTIVTKLTIARYSAPERKEHTHWFFMSANTFWLSYCARVKGSTLLYFFKPKTIFL